MLVNAAVAAVSLSIVFAAGEIAARILWKSAPPVVTPRNELRMVQSPDMREGFYYAPNTKGCGPYECFSINSQGLREREIPKGGTRGRTRMIVSGDSFMFGTALAEEDVFSRRLEEAYNKSGANVEAINAGIVGHNFTQETAALRRIVPYYRPDVVLVVLIYNDTELLGLSPEGWTPALHNFEKGSVPKYDRRRDKIYNSLLPKKNKGLCERLRWAAGSRSRLYQYVALRFHSPYMPYMYGDREFALFRTPSCQGENLFWRKFRLNLEELQKMGRKYHFQPVIVFYMDIKMEGYAFNRMRREVDASKLPYLDLSYLWGDEREYVRRHSLGWGHHPNKTAMAAAARTTAGYLSHTGLGPRGEGLEKYFDAREYGRVTLERNRAHYEKEREQLERYEELRKGFEAEIDFSRGGFEPDQLLYGWWDADFTKKLGRAGVRWMPLQAAALLRNPGGASALRIEGEAPAGVLEKFGSYTIGVSFECGPPVVSDPIRAGRFNETFEIPVALRGEDVLEVSISTDIYATPEAMGVKKGNLRVVGLGVRRMAVE